MARSTIGVSVVALIVAAVLGVVVIIQSQGVPHSSNTPLANTTAGVSSSTSTTETPTVTSPLASSTNTELTTQSTCTGGTTTIGANGTILGVSQSSPCECVLADSNTNGDLYVSPNPKVGDTVCLQASDKNSMEVGITVTNSTGSVVFSTICAASGGAGPGGETCEANWNTSLPDPQGDPITPGTYIVAASDSLEANVTLSA